MHVVTLCHVERCLHVEPFTRARQPCTLAYHKLTTTWNELYLRPPRFCIQTAITVLRESSLNLTTPLQRARARRGSSRPLLDDFGNQINWEDSRESSDGSEKNDDMVREARLALCSSDTQDGNSPTLVRKKSWISRLSQRMSSREVASSSVMMSSSTTSSLSSSISAEQLSLEDDPQQVPFGTLPSPRNSSPRSKSLQKRRSLSLE